MKTGTAWRSLFMAAVLAVIWTGHSCNDDKGGADAVSQDTVKEIGEYLAFETASTSPSAPAKPTLVITDPSLDGQYFPKTLPSTSIKVTMKVTNWGTYPQAGKSIICRVNGVVDGSTSGLTYTFADVPDGQSTLTCELAAGGEPLKNCEARASRKVKVYQPCTKPGPDPICDDGNPCSIESCTPVAGGYDCHYADNPAKPNCCLSDYDCPCGMTCSEELGECVECKTDAEADDGNICTEDKCVNGKKTNTWIYIDGKKCCNPTDPDPDAVCDDSKYCTIDFCDLTAQVCVHVDNGDPKCCEAPDFHKDDKCDDGLECTTDLCIGHECRHGPVPDPNCCEPNDSCDDGNPCTDDACSCVDQACSAHTCTHVANDLENCCTSDWECGEGGPMDDNDICTIDYCNNFQCVHVVNTGCCDNVKYFCTEDTNPCTIMTCNLETHKCENTGPKECCVDASACDDGKVCTKNICVIPEGEITGTCSYVPIPGCCSTDAECSDDNPCTLDACINNVCRHGPDPLHENCCTVAEDCVSTECVISYCDFATHTCVESLVVPHDPPCCFENKDCDDGKPETVDKCSAKHKCYYFPSDTCGPTVPCLPTDECDIATCNETTWKCEHTAKPGCCTSDYVCSLPGYTDNDVCTTDKCIDNKCTFIPIAQCCSSDADCNEGGQWDDFNACTVGVCLNHTCKHIVKSANCCTSDKDCEDGNVCTINSCDLDTNTCLAPVVNLDSKDPICCVTKSDCYSTGMPCKDYKCENYTCQYTDIPGCCTVYYPPPNDNVIDQEASNAKCDDGKPCTYDLCVYGNCRHLERDVAPPGTVPDNCCPDLSFCEPPGECMECYIDEDGFCQYKAVPCSRSLPYEEKFTGCSPLSSYGWTQVDLGWGKTAKNWVCVTSGSLGPDEHYRFNWSPQVSMGFDSYIVTPPLNAEGLSAVTLQYARDYQHYKGDTDLGIYVVQDTDNSDSIDAADTFIPIWAETFSDDLPAEVATYTIPGQFMSDSLRLAFQVKSTTSYNLDYFDIDDVRVCPGVPPVVKSVPSSINVEWNSVAYSKITGYDPDDMTGLKPVTFTLKSGPSFVEVKNSFWVAPLQHWHSQIVVDPSSPDDIGEHTVVITMSDGCVKKDITIKVNVLVAEGYIVWAPPGAPAAHADALKQAIKAAGKTVQVVDDLGLFASLEKIKGIFIVAGIYGAKHVLTNAEVAAVTKYLDGGGKVYLEGGDTWAFDSWTNLHPYFKVEGIADGDQIYAGPVEGRHFCYQLDFAVSTDFMVNNFLDQIDRKVNSGSIPILWDGAGGNFAMSVAYEDPTKKYRTIASSIPLAALVDGPAATKNTLIAKYIDFFENGYPKCTMDEQCGDSIVCTEDRCIDGVCSNVEIPNCIVCVDDRDCPEGQGCILSNHICKQIPGIVNVSTDTPITIPSLTPSEIKSTINVTNITGSAKQVNVKLRLQHTYRGDLTVTLTHVGISVVLVCPSATDSNADYYRTYDLGVANCGEPMDKLEGLGANGAWTLTVNDGAPLNGGKLLGWELYIDAKNPPCTADSQCDDGAKCTIDDCFHPDYPSTVDPLPDEPEQVWGTCVYTEDTCTDYDPPGSVYPNLCTTDWCDPDLGCVHQEKDCDDGNPCTIDSCIPLTGKCKNEKVNNCTAACKTHDDCGLNDYCHPTKKVCTPVPYDVLLVPTDSFPIAIPDATPADVISTIHTTSAGKVSGINVKVLIEHPYSGDLTVNLSNGTHTIKLHKQTGGAADNVYRVYDIAEKPDDPLKGMSVFIGDLVAGDWTLTVHDWVSGDSGKLKDWRLFILSSPCITNNDCDDSNMCTTDFCDLAAKVCINTPIECDDGAWCNGTEICDPELGCLPGIPPILDDGIACTADFCSEATKEVLHTPQDAACDDGLFCNGVETCDSVKGCLPGVPPELDDGIPCTKDTCDEEGDVVQHIPQDAWCDNDLYCDGVEKCDPKLGCVSGDPPKLDDGIECTIDECNEELDIVTHTVTHALCDDNLWCNGIETCDSELGCLPGTPPELSDGIECTMDLCDEETHEISHVPDHLACDDGLWCNGIETCIAEVGCVSSSPPKVIDTVSCTIDTCDEENDQIVHTPDPSLCIYSGSKDPQCVEATCDPVKGCIFSDADGAPCEDGEQCTVNDFCQAGVCMGGGPALDNPKCVDCTVHGCEFDGDLCNGTLKCDITDGLCKVDLPPVVCEEHPDQCMTNVCQKETGKCVAVPKELGTPCDDGQICTWNDVCNGAGLCIGTMNTCSDGHFCNGEEKCDPETGACSPGVPPVLSDGIGCTMDYCDEINDVVVHVPNDAYCSDGLFCNGLEVCDPAAGCKAGTPALDDGIPCTEDSCDETLDVFIHTPNNAACDDHQFCNGTEICSKTQGCLPGTPVSIDDGIECTLDSCDEATDTVVHEALHGVCDDGNDCNGQEYCSVTEGCKSGPAPVLDDGISCTLDSCVDGVLAHTPDDALCDDGLWCNGKEKCDPDQGCISGTPSPVDDGVACTVDYCDEETDQIVHQTDDTKCDNGKYCDGTEFCDPAQGCVSGSPPDCSDDDPCTLDWCNPALNGGIGACDNTQKVQYCTATCGGTHPYDAGDDDCGYDDACVGGLGGPDAGLCTPICKESYCAVASSGVINSPLNDGQCVSKTLTVDPPYPLVVGVNVKVELLHSQLGDLRVNIKDPAGTSVPLWAKSTGGSFDNFFNTFTLSYPNIPGDLCVFQGHAAAGNWTLEVCDDSSGNVGWLQAWALYLETSSTDMSKGDTCANANVIDSSDGTLVLPGTTLCANDDYSSTCGGAAAADRVYKFTIAKPTKVVFDVNSSFNAIIYLKGSAGDTCAADTLMCADTCPSGDCHEKLTKRLMNPGTYYFFVDGAPNVSGSYSLSATFKTLAENGEPCELSDECISNHCSNGFCCDEGICCNGAATCPPEFTILPTCDDKVNCQGHRGDPQCNNFQCSMLIIEDDSGCEGEVSNLCGCFLSALCTGEVEQSAAVCDTTCIEGGVENDELCDPECHCDPLGCEEDYEDGMECDEDSDCISSHCQNGFCCSAGNCCNTPDDCPDELYLELPVCDDPGTCQGHRKDKVCVKSSCGSNVVEDDSACHSEMVANDCGYYLPVKCTGEVDQVPPVCPSSCVLDEECDPNAHCDDICLPDLENGEPCDEDSDCISGHCENGFCCEQGACCSTAQDCPASFSEPPVCDSSKTCQGHRIDAACLNFQCYSVQVNDDSACWDGMLADECGLYKSITCTGEVDQPIATCPTECLSDSDCDEIAHCDEECELDYPNGTPCDEDSDCISNHCQNGFCCDKGDCCIVPNNCPDSYKLDPVCDDPSTCQGHRLDKRCINFICSNEPIPDDSGCTEQTESDTCGCFLSVFCNGLPEQGDPPCPETCTLDEECDPECHCDDVCTEDLPLAAPCDEDSDCQSGFCVDGVCCDGPCSKVCESCKLEGTTGHCTPYPANTDPEDDCGLCSVCGGTSACVLVPDGLDPLDECPMQPESTCMKDGTCNGAGNCRLWALGTECIAQTCVGNIMYPPAECDGKGVCVEAGSVSCVPYMCDDAGFDCRTECSSDAHCSPGYWCNTAGACVSKQSNGKPCGPEFAFGNVGNGGSQCISGFCADGLCCDMDCAQECRACNLPGSEGTCTFHGPNTDPDDDCTECMVCNGFGECIPAAAGTDPTDDCEQADQATCKLDGTCDGNGACRFWLPGTICVEQSCVTQAGGMEDYQINADTCDGLGTCVDNMFKPCYPYVCNGTWGCFQNCVTDAECAPDSWCRGSECVLKKDNGETCSGPTAGNECKSGFCVDGYCCDTACDGICQACNLEGTEGTCTGHPLNTDPEDDCGLCQVCSGDSKCQFAAAGTDPTNDCEADSQQTCKQDGTCDGNGACRLWLPGTVCAEQTCIGATRYPADLCDGLGVCVDTPSEECLPYVCNESQTACRTFCENDSHCYEDHWCTPEQKCIHKYDLGHPCLGNNECMSNMCVDGYCCSSLCTETCGTCVPVDPPDPNIPPGTCHPYEVTTDIEDECPPCQVCSGDFSCTFVPDGADPMDDCVNEGEFTCQQDGLCDGTGKCRLWAAGTICNPQHCVDHILHWDDKCDGLGTCIDGGTLDCEPYTCADDGVVCRTDCLDDTHCTSSNWCDTFVLKDNKCKAKFPNGFECVQGNQCQSSFCVDGVCCDSPCEGVCRNCALPGQEGKCSFNPNDTDEEGDCPLCDVCNGAGACKHATAGTDPKNECTETPKESCKEDGYCDGNGACRLWSTDTVCVAQTCIGQTRYPDDFCDGMGNCVDSGEEDCAPYMCNDSQTDCRTFCFVDEHCTAGNYCTSDNVCTEKKNNGEMCNADNWCKSGHCVDGFCCDTACDTTCVSCSISWNAPCTITDDGKLTDWTLPDHRLGIGASGVRYYITWDDAYVYVAVKGVNLASDNLYFAFDVDLAPKPDSGVAEAKGGVAFTGDRKPEYLVTFRGNNNIRLSTNTGGSWGPDTEVNTWKNYAGSATNLVSELRIPKANLGSLDPDVGFAVWMWATSNDEVDVWSIWPDSNPTGLAVTEAPNAQFVKAGPGMCKRHYFYTDPDFECGVCKLCDGNGACMNVNDNEDPKDDCVQDDVSTCGQDGLCDGEGKCGLWAPTTVCTEQTCVGFTLYPADFCDGNGTCVDTPSVDCAPYVCDADGINCLTACAGDALGDPDCQPMYYCLGNECVNKKSNGETCTEARECLSNHCVDGYCCDTACDKACEACNKPGKEGTCTFHEADSDPEDDCPLCEVCSGNSNACVKVMAGFDPVGDCAQDPVSTCQQDGTCDGAGACRLYLPGTVCHPQYCSDFVTYLNDTCDGLGTCTDGGSTNCHPYACDDAGFECRTDCFEDAHCYTGPHLPPQKIAHYCDLATNTCVPKKKQGEGCTANNECLSTFCVDGFCCDTACDGPCQACNKVSGPVGTCTYHENNTDPDQDCGFCGACNGAGACKPMPSGMDPYDMCTEEPPSTCGQDGFCDGNYKCRLWNDSTVCVEQTCVDHIKYPNDYCDGFGECVDSGEVDCEPYVCNAEGTECLFSCQDDTACMPLYWCEGQSCVPKKKNGETCEANNQCLSGFCVDGYCCDTACAGTCESCAQENHLGVCTPYPKGTDPELECTICDMCDGQSGCIPVPAGEDPFNQCAAADPATCGLDGTCDGKGECRLYLPGTVCVPQYCEVDTQFEADVCDGIGSCLDSGSKSCEPYVCDAAGVACRTFCEDDSHCMAKYWCSGAVCVPKKPLGETCLGGNECLSNFCVDGYCCNSPCEQTCESCATFPGLCLPYELGTDPDDECDLCYSCSGASSCILVPEGYDGPDDCVEEPVSTCGQDGTCDGAGACRLWVAGTVCTPQYCVDGYQHFDDLCDGMGQCVDGGKIACTPYVCDDEGYACLTMCTENDDCVGTHWCDVPNCVLKKEIGFPCVDDAECMSNHCADGVCCNTACDGVCEHCNLTNQSGICSFIPNFTDPENECGICNLCNGAGLCTPVPAGLDPKNDCPQFPQSTCQTDGFCDGSGACRFWDETTICKKQTCLGSTLSPADYCSGKGECIDSGTQSCCPYMCWNNACRNSCSHDVHCCVGNYCSGAKCVPKKQDGETCSSSNQCLSGFCIDGYCCNEACSGPCRACDVPTFEGTCTNYAANTDPEFECPSCWVCNGAGSCKPAPDGTDVKNDCWQDIPQTCGYDGLCDGAGSCRFWNDTTVCNPQLCEGYTLYPADYCDGFGNCVDAGETSCCPYACGADGLACRTGCLEDFDCCPDFYCNSGVCVPRLLDGATCSTHSQCLSGYCVDGYCCNTPCSSTCESCGLAGHEGVCTFYPANSDPENNCPPCYVCSGVGNQCVLVPEGKDYANDCPALSPNSCGYTGECDGKGKCQFWPAGTECFPQYCVGGYVYKPDVCNGNGVCTDGGFESCMGYACDDAGLDCRTSCAKDTECLPGYYCSDEGKCVPKKPNGTPCTDSSECVSWYCVDGYCCDGPCGGQCQACNQPGQEGTCVNLPNNTDPDNECGICKVCSGGGFCKPVTAGTDVKDDCEQLPAFGCGYDGECDGLGACRYWVEGTECAPQSCTGSTLYLQDTCNGFGLCMDGGTVSCAPYKCQDNVQCKTSCTLDADCVAGFYCSGQQCVAKKVNGSPCSAANECLSNYCVDGYCCSSACAGSCRACNVVGHEGICTFHTANTDPEAECGLCMVCNGTGACTAALEGTDPKNECPSTDPHDGCGTDGVCNGKGACRKWPGGTICFDQTCTLPGDFSATRYCDGNGNCVAPSNSCENLNWDKGLGSPWVCSGTGTCAGLVTFSEAVAACIERGGRLCTWEEIANREAQGAGCGYDNQRIWTLSECGEDKYWTGPANPDNLGAIPKECTPSTNKAYVVCCSDFDSCCPYKCMGLGGGGCLAVCGSDADCCEGNWCKGGKCIPKSGLGTPCNTDQQCPDGHCVDGYCCNTACDNICEACNLPGLEGTCSPIPNNTDPANECGVCSVCDGAGKCKHAAAGTDPGSDCIASPEATCGFTGLCDGNGACAFWPPTTVCTVQMCVDHTLYAADMCDGAGNCVDGGSTDCCPYLCNALGTDCRKNCTNNGQCCPGNFCLDGVCTKKKGLGDLCTNAFECVSGFCVDGVCCDSACNGVCQSCNLPGSNGYCTNHANNTDNDNECGLCKVCNGAGACKNAPVDTDPKNDCAPSPEGQKSCGFTGVCNGSGGCAYWGPNTVCKEQSCSGSTLYLADKCNGMGACVDSGQQSCCPYKCGVDACLSTCSNDNDCCSGNYCKGNMCAPQKINGQTCSTNAECLSGKCVDGYCCDSWCAGLCQACNLPGKLGKCSFHPAVTDPEGDCGTCRVCDGAGGCTEVPAGQDPLSHCEQFPSSTCKTDGTCDGAGACRFWSDTTICNAQTCVGSILYPTDYCNGSGICVDSGSIDCCPYVCSGNSCRTNCTENSHCCPGFFCLSGTCQDKKGNGLPCATNSECVSDYCVDGYCCNAPCNGECEACNIPGHEGECTFHAVKTDPDNECGVCAVCDGAGKCQPVPDGSDYLDDCEQEAPCGLDGWCNGAKACRLWPKGTECNPQSCSGATLYLADQCDGFGICVDSGTKSCAPYKCSGNVCATNCATDADCVVSSYCSASKCVPKKGLGEPCTGNSQCLSGYCVDGVCCDGPCSGVCRSCALAGNVGTCTFIGNNLDPELECGKCKACNGAGACKPVPAGQDPKDDCPQSEPFTCGMDGACDGNGACRFWSNTTVCADQSCLGSMLYPVDYCSGTGTCVDTPAVSCCPFLCDATACKTSCTTNADCCSDSYCNGSACVNKKPNGQACANNGECASGMCVDGFCCNSWCNGLCEGCNVVGKEGTCSPRPAGTDPENECLPCNQCNGAGACEPVPYGEDPFGDCLQTPENTCGQSGACDGAGNCAMWPDTTVCNPQVCIENMLHLPDYCNGAGVCVDSGSKSCCPYMCSGNSCRVNCQTDAHCCPGNWCSSGSCVPKKANGETCSSGNECASGFCVDGYCCDKQCNGKCEACNVAGFEGLCTFHSYLTDPDDDCGVCAVCDGAGKCINAAAGTDPFNDCEQTPMESCGFDGTCDGNGACRYWGTNIICHAQICTDHTFNPTDFCDGKGHCVDSGAIDCCPFLCLGDACRTSCTVDLNCCTNALCKSNQVCQTCSTSKPCGSGNWCCYGDICDSAIEVASTTDSTSGVNQADGIYYSSTYGNTNQFQWNCCANQYGTYAHDRVFHFHTKNDTVGVELTVKVWGNFDTILYMRRGECGGDATPIVYNDDGCGLGSGSCFTVKLHPGYDFWVYVDGFSKQKGDFTIQFDFTSLCGNCVCDSAYGENASNNPVECWQSGDYCGNYINIPITGRPQRFVFDHNLAGNHEDFSHYWGSGNYNPNSCAGCGLHVPACHDELDKIYRLHLPWPNNYVIIRMHRNGSWNPSNYPRVFVWKHPTCDFNGSQSRVFCMSLSNDLQVGSQTSAYILPAGTYWIITDMYYEQSTYSAPYRLWVTVGTKDSFHL